MSGAGESFTQVGPDGKPETVVPGDTRCLRWPSTCAEVQARTPTCFNFCDFCTLGPPDPPPQRRDQEGISLAEAERRVAKVEGERGEKLRQAVAAVVSEPPPNPRQEAG